MPADAVVVQDAARYLRSPPSAASTRRPSPTCRSTSRRRGTSPAIPTRVHPVGRRPEERCLEIYGTLGRFAGLDPGDYQDVAFAAEDARFASCDPLVLVLVTHDGAAIVADLAGCSTHVFEPARPWRVRVRRRAHARRLERRDRKLRVKP